MKTLQNYAAILRKRRDDLGLSQQDMRLKIGMSQQQYQRIEAGADTRLSTLLRVLDGLDMELVLIPKESVRQVEQQLTQLDQARSADGEKSRGLSPWQLVKDLEDD